MTNRFPSFRFETAEVHGDLRPNGDGVKLDVHKCSETPPSNRQLDNTPFDSRYSGKAQLDNTPPWMMKSWRSFAVLMLTLNKGSSLPSKPSK